MSEELEIEYKNMVSEDEFLKVQQYFNIKEEDFFKQENDYFDTDDFSLKEIGCALRVRKKAGKFEFTLKEPQDIGLLETNEIISETDHQKLLDGISFPPGEIADKLRQLHIPLGKITFFGTLTTYRKELQYKEGLLVLDKSYYLNKQDFEIEYEVEDPDIGYKNFLELLSFFQIPKRHTENKIIRFYNKRLADMQAL